MQQTSTTAWKCYTTHATDLWHSCFMSSVNWFEPLWLRVCRDRFPRNTGHSFQWLNPCKWKKRSKIINVLKMFVWGNKAFFTASVQIQKFLSQMFDHVAFRRQRFWNFQTSWSCSRSQICYFSTFLVADCLFSVAGKSDSADTGCYSLQNSWSTRHGIRIC